MCLNLHPISPLRKVSASQNASEIGEGRTGRVARARRDLKHTNEARAILGVVAVSIMAATLEPGFGRTEHTEPFPVSISTQTVQIMRSML